MNIETRRKVERQIVRAAAKGLIAAGYAVTVDFGMDEPGIEASTSIEAIMAEAQACDEEWLFAMKADEGGTMRKAGMVSLSTAMAAGTLSATTAWRWNRP